MLLFDTYRGRNAEIPGGVLTHIYHKLSYVNKYHDTFQRVAIIGGRTAGAAVRTRKRRSVATGYWTSMSPTIVVWWGMQTYWAISEVTSNSRVWVSPSWSTISVS